MDINFQDLVVNPVGVQCFLKFRLSLTISVFLLVVTPIVITSLVTMETAQRALQLQAAQFGLSLRTENLEIQRLRENIIYLLIIGSVVSLAGAGIFASELAGSVNVIKRGLDSLSRDVNVTIRPLRGVLGEIAASINQMAEVLRETRNHRDALLESSPNGIITIDKHGKVILFNPAASNLTGLEPTLTLGTNFAELGMPPIVKLLADTLTGEATVLAKEEVIVRPDGIALSVAISTSHLHNYLGELVGALAVITDLREKRLLEAQVLRANRLAGLGTLAAGVAHEIRNPLTSIKGYTQVLEEELAPTDARLEYTGIIVKEVNRLDRIVRSLLAFARPGESKFCRENLNSIIEETLVLLDNAAFRRRIELQKDCGENLWAEVDRDQLKQVMLNLFARQRPLPGVKKPPCRPIP